MNDKKLTKHNFVKYEFNELYLRELKTNNEWFHYHRIRKNELFKAYLPDITYDPNHPSTFHPDTKHYVFYKGEDIIGTVFTDRLDEKRVALRLLAIDAGLKNKGYGSSLLKQIEAITRMEGYKTILLHANAPAYNFYKRNGYIEMEFDEQYTGNSCIDMGKIL